MIGLDELVRIEVERYVSRSVDGYYFALLIRIFFKTFIDVKNTLFYIVCIYIIYYLLLYEDLSNPLSFLSILSNSSNSLYSLK